MSDSRLKLPEEFCDRMRLQLGSEFESFLNSHHTKSPVSIRFNSSKSIAQYGIEIPWCKNGKYLDKRPIFTLDPDFHAGGYYVQEASSMFLEQVFIQLGLTSKPLHILDSCAAPGGKSTHVIDLMHNDSLLVSNEVIRSRAAILAENMIKWGGSNYVVSNNDPRDFKSLPGFFDVILVDAPCSGEGLFRKDHHASNEWSSEHTEHCAKRQQRILADIWPSLKTNGILIYCTCTFNISENEENINWLVEHQDAESIPLQTDPSWGIQENTYRNATGYRFYPHKTKGEGFFIAAVKKTGNSNDHSMKFRNIKETKSNKLIESCRDWVHHQDSIIFQQDGEHVSIIHKSHQNALAYLNQNLNLVAKGIRIATAKANKLVPTHDLAMSVFLNKEIFPQFNLSREDALIYLKKELPYVNQFGMGYTLATYKSLPLGWLNSLDARMNNLYPKEWRIRMDIPTTKE